MDGGDRLGMNECAHVEKAKRGSGGGRREGGAAWPEGMGGKHDKDRHRGTGPSVRSRSHDGGTLRRTILAVLHKGVRHWGHCVGVRGQGYLEPVAPHALVNSFIFWC